MSPRRWLLRRGPQLSRRGLPRSPPDFGALSQNADARHALENRRDWIHQLLGRRRVLRVAVRRSTHPLPPTSSHPPHAVRSRTCQYHGSTRRARVIVLNAVACLATALLFEAFLLTTFVAGDHGLLGGCLFVTSASSTARSASQCCNRPAPSSASDLHQRCLGHARAFMLASVLGVLTRKCLDSLGLLWLLAAPTGSLSAEARPARKRTGHGICTTSPCPGWVPTGGELRLRTSFAATFPPTATGCSSGGRSSV